MNTLIRSILLIFLCIVSGRLVSQVDFQELDEVYGLDSKLFCGKKYSYFLPSGTEGTQFLYSTDFVPGDIVIRWKGDKVIRWGSEEGFLLNYDIYNQLLLLKYYDETGAEQIIEISDAWLESFSLGANYFKCLNVNDDVRIYQILGNEKNQIAYYWRKNLKLTNSSGPANYAFSEPIKTRFVMMNGNLLPYSSNGSFIKNFDPVYKDILQSYLKENDISVKKASDQTMTDLLNFISNLN
jgi:hypothetical protein